ncbi:MAG: transposase [Bradyrhizobium sp.]|uniref:transposase n=1 Tax=Bradyrhizobium sp. TaxID=376 RepID=UPI003D0DD1FA
MAYVNLYSLKGEEALLKALETPAVQRIANGKLRADDAVGMEEEQVWAAMRLIRWPETKGAPLCPKCDAERPYFLSTRNKWRCRLCGHHFSLLSGTILASGKMPLRNYLFALGMILDRAGWESIMQLSRELGCNYRTAYYLFQKMKACAEGEPGATMPVALISRTAWKARRVRGFESLRTRAADLPYPYLPSAPKDEGAELVALVNNMVPRGLPDYIRADICQDMLVSILAGEVTAKEIGANVKGYVSKVLSDSPWKYRWVSFDVPIGEGKRTLHEIIAAPS